MNISITLKSALEKASPSLRKKMQHTVDLLHKAYPLALKYAPDEGFYVGVSFGKDSQALYHMMQLAGVKFHPYFSPTSVDPPEVIRFGRKYYPEVEFVKLNTNIYEVFKSMKVLPSMRIRWCCAHFKERGGEGKVVCTGIRKAESVRRSRRNEIEVSGRKFSGHMDEFEDWQERKIKKQMKNLNQDQFSEAKENEVRCINGHDKILLNPIIEWSEADVWEFLNKVVEVPYCELYDQGWTRIGCICCPMASIKSTLRDIKRWPHVKEKWIKAIMEVRKESILGNTPPIPYICKSVHRMGTAIRRQSQNIQQLQSRILEGSPDKQSEIGRVRYESTELPHTPIWRDEIDKAFAKLNKTSHGNMVGELSLNMTRKEKGRLQKPSSIGGFPRSPLIHGSPRSICKESYSMMKISNDYFKIDLTI